MVFWGSIAASALLFSTLVLCCMVLNARSNEEQRALDLLTQDRLALRQFEHVAFQPLPQQPQPPPSLHDDNAPKKSNKKGKAAHPAKKNEDTTLLKQAVVVKSQA